MRPTNILLLTISALTIPACRSAVVDRADRDVYALIDSRQKTALGIAHDSRLTPKSEPQRAGSTGDPYGRTPHPLPARIPEPFDTKDSDSSAPPHQADAPPDAPSESSQDLIPMSIFTPEESPEVNTFGLQDALSCAVREARDLQNAKEELYLAALELTLQRHLWTPQFVASVEAAFDKRPDTEDPQREGIMIEDRAMQTVSELAVRQRLPYGGEVAARVIHTLVRQVTDEVSKGESGRLILEGNLPLLKGAGRAAETYESLLSSERRLIYAVRTYEQFRRRFLVDIARDYFNLQQIKASVANTYNSYVNRWKDWEKADFIERLGRSRTIAEAPRAKANFRSAEARLVSAKERYETALDRFKIRLALPVDALLDVADQDKDEESKVVDKLLPDVTEEAAVNVALNYRLDLLNSADRVDDARRGVQIAENKILPDLNLAGSVTLDSDPDQLRPTSWRNDRLTWHGGINLQMDDRKTERNDYRRSLIDVRKSLRDHEEFVDTVRADVRRALRQIVQQENLRTIQELNVRENDLRLEGARQQLELGRSRTNQDVVDAENDLLGAKNDLAAAIADYRIAILDFRLATGTLRVTDDGRWVTREVFEAAREESDVQGVGGG